MPNLYELAVRTSNVTTANAALEIIGSSNQRTRLYELGITLVTAVSTTLGLGRPAAIGVTPATATTALGEDTNDTAISQIALTWGTSPTAPTAYMRRFSANSIGGGVIWTFPQGVVMGTSGITRNLVLFNITGGATLDVYAVLGE